MGAPTVLDDRAAAAAPDSPTLTQQEADARSRGSYRSDAIALGVLAFLFALLTAASWRKWGVPPLDAGAELTTAERVADGAVPYRDVRYFYGPAGLYSLVMAFKLFGVGLTTAFAFGLAQAAAIVAAFYALARQWLRPAVATASAALLLAIGFSGTAFNFVLPHSNSATFGLLALLLCLLALCRERPWAAGAALGFAGLTRPEFFAVSALAAAVWLLAGARGRARRELLADAARIALPGLGIPVAVLGSFAALAGAHRLLLENLWPVDFIRVAGLRSQEHWAPLTASSAAATAGRALVYCGLLAIGIAAVGLWRSRTGAARALALLPVLAGLAALAALDGIARYLGTFDAARVAVERETGDLVLGMTWLPALAIGVAIVAVLAAWRRREPPLGRSWPADAALIAVALALGLRAYDAFNAEASYAPYYAAPLVLLAGVFHRRLGERFAGAATAATAALAVAAAGLAAYALGGLYSDNSTVVHTARGSFVANDEAAPALQRALDLVRARTEPGEPIAALPADGGFYFLADRPPATYEVMFLPGLVDSVADERRILQRLDRSDTRIVVVSARDFSAFGLPTFGVDYDRHLAAGLRRRFRPIATIGDLGQPVAGSYPSAAFTVYERR
jgi:hypothetical protein